VSLYCTNQQMDMAPFPQADLSQGFCDGDAKGDVAVQSGETVWRSRRYDARPYRTAHGATSQPIPGSNQPLVPMLRNALPVRGLLALQRVIAGRPVRDPVSRRCPLAHTGQLNHLSHNMNPSWFCETDLSSLANRSALRLSHLQVRRTIRITDRMT